MTRNFTLNHKHYKYLWKQHLVVAQLHICQNQCTIISVEWYWYSILAVLNFPEKYNNIFSGQWFLNIEIWWGVQVLFRGRERTEHCFYTVNNMVDGDVTTQGSRTSAAEVWTMMTYSNENIFRVTGPLWLEFTGQRWIPLTKTSDADLRCFLWCAPE